MELNALRAALRGLSAYREIKDQPVMAQALRLLDALAQGLKAAGEQLFTSLS